MGDVILNIQRNSFFSFITKSSLRQKTAFSQLKKMILCKILYWKNHKFRFITEKKKKKKKKKH